MKHTKQSAGRLGGLSTVQKYGPEYMKRLGKRGAQSTWSKYKLVPEGLNDFAMVEVETGRVVAFQSGKPVREE